MSWLKIRDVQDIQFFNNPSSCISHFEKTFWTKKAVSLIESFGSLFMYALNKMHLVGHRVELQMNPWIHAKGFSKKKLIVCIHGLNNNPSQFKYILDEVQKKGFSETDLFIPHVLQGGNAKLDEMVKPIFKEIANWAKTPGEKELVLVGISNGGRIARAIEVELAKPENHGNIKRLRFVSIVGACRGSSLVNLANKVGLSFLMSKNIAEEMPVGSLRNQKLDREWMQGLAHGPIREYTFFASPHDWQVTNYDSSLMEIPNQNARYAIIDGHGHNSIVHAVSKTVAEIVLM